MIINFRQVPLLLFFAFISMTAFAQTQDTLQLLRPFVPSRATQHLLFETRPGKTTTAAVSEIRTEELRKTNSASFGGLLAGRLAGLYVTQPTGEPGNDDVSYLLRGQAPLVLIDGTPQSFVSLNPEQIESITLLKDAVSTTMLGMRSSNGALLITTKKGTQANQSLEFTALQGIQQPTRMPSFLHAYPYAQLYNEALSNEGKPAAYSQADLDAYKNHTDPIGHPDVDWQKKLLKDQASFARYDLSVSGGNKTARYFANLDYMHQDGLFRTEKFNSYNTNPDYKRYIFRSNLELDLNKYVTTSLNLFGRIQSTNQPGVATAGIYSLLAATPNNAYPVVNADGSLGGNLDYTSNIYGQSVQTGYQSIYERDFKVDVVVKGNLDNVTKGLWIKGLAAINAYQRETTNRSKTFAVFRQSVDTAGNTVYSQFGAKGNQSNTTAINSQNRLIYTEASLGYSKSIGDHNLDALVLASNDYRMINSDLPMNFSGVSGKLSYNYKRKYLLDVAVGYNGTERYPQSKRYGTFPAFGAGWNIADEDFLKNVKWLNSLKLRASYGKTGNANIGYYNYNQYYVGGTGYGFGATVPSSTTTLQQGALANPTITWEKANKFSTGIDASLLNDRLSLSIDYFNDKYYDLIQQRQDRSDVFGAAFNWQNIGSFRYKGWELQATWQNSRGAFTYFVSPNFSLLKSTVLYYGEPRKAYEYNMFAGRPVTQIYGYVSEGLFQSQAEIAGHAYQGGGILPGDIKYKDLNGDGFIDGKDQEAIGNRKPLLYYGLNTGVRYKGFDLTVLAQGVANRDVYLSGSSYWGFQSNGKGQVYEEQLNRWTPDHSTAASYPRLWIGNNANNTAGSSFWVRKGDYLRIKNIELGYSLPAPLVGKAKMTLARVFVNATNLFTFTSLKNMDPEDYNGLYPIMKIINAGLTIKF